MRGVVLTALGSVLTLAGVVPADDGSGQRSTSGGWRPAAWLAPVWTGQTPPPTPWVGVRTPPLTWHPTPAQPARTPALVVASPSVVHMDDGRVSDHVVLVPREQPTELPPVSPTAPDGPPKKLSPPPAAKEQSTGPGAAGRAEPDAKPVDKARTDAPSPAAPPVATPSAPVVEVADSAAPSHPAHGLLPPAGEPFVFSRRVPDISFGSAPVRLAHESLLGIDRTSGLPRAYVSTEYLLWWLNDYRVPPLATTDLGASTGFVGQPGTVVLFGPGDDRFGARSGVRVTGVLWLDDCQSCGIDGSFFSLGSQSFGFNASSNQFARIDRPFFSTNLNAEVAEDVVAPGLSTGGLSIKGSSRLWGADLNGRWNCFNGCNGRVDFFGGFRYLELSEQLDIVEALVAGPLAPNPVGTRTVVDDRFTTRNQFYGGQLGTYLEQGFDRWYVGLRASVALGDTHQTIDIRGSQLQVRPGQPPVSFVGGLLAIRSNIGRFGHDEFSAVPEMNLRVGYRVTDHFRVFGGYGFLYWPRVARPGDQIDRVVDVTLVPNPPPGVLPSGAGRPMVPFRQSDLWAHGLNLGLQLDW